MPLSSTEIDTGALHDNPVSVLKLAVGADSVAKFMVVTEYMGIEGIMRERFDHGMNILNLAIDQESINIVVHLSETLSPTQVKSLVNHRYGKGM